MKKEEKAKAIEKIQADLSRSKLVVAADYRGLTASEMTMLRRRLREAGVEFHVVKNTLTRLAASQASKPSLESLLEGPTAMAFGYQDEVSAANVLVNYVRSSRSTLRIKGALIGQQVIASGEVQNLAALPPREVLVARALGQLKAPLAFLHGVLSAPLRGLVGVVQARLKQVESQDTALRQAQDAAVPSA